MNGFFSVVFIIFCAFFSSISCVDYFVSPFVSCGTTCRGTGIQPFDNLLVALNTASRQTTQSTIYLLSDAEAPHYVMTDQAGDVNYTVPSTNFQLTNIVIRPLFCNDAAVRTFSALASNCTQTGGSVTVYFKTTNFTISILNSLQVQNVIFDGIEDIQVWNPINTRVDQCLQNRQRCCEEVSLTSSLISSLFCARTGDYSSLNLAPRQGIFDLTGTGGGTMTRTLSFSNVVIQNFVSPQAISLIQTGAVNFKLTFTDVTIDNVYFGSGLVFHSEDQGATNSSTVTLSGVTFSNYNYWDLYSQDKTRGEGYLFYGNSIFSGLFQITTSTFTNISVSTRSTCSAPLQVNYQRPSSNSLATYPRSRTDLWSSYHSDHRQIANMSSLIYIKSIYGAVSIQDSDFTNIIGTSGSVLRVDDSVDSGNWFTIYNSVFDNNFAFDGFANIRIVKQSDAAFANMLKCPNIEISGSQFSNSYGCPGAYGNVLLLCYWDTQPPTNSLSLSNYNLPGDYNDVGIFLDEATGVPHVSVVNSVFQGNRLSVSNSLAIIGAQLANLTGNTIQNNGGTSSGLYINAIQNSYFAIRYASKINSMGLQITNHFGQSSSVYVDHAIRLSFRRNTYKNNFGPFEGSTALGAALSIRNQIELAGALIFINDYFSGHQGIPTDMAQNLQATLFKNNLVSPPMIALHFDKTASQAVLPAGRRTGFTTLMNGVIFFNNTLQFDYATALSAASLTSYNATEIMPPVFQNYARFSSGLLKLLTNIEVIDVYMGSTYVPDRSDSRQRTFAFMNGQIINNFLLKNQGTGCFFPSLGFTRFFIQNIAISFNNITDELQTPFPGNNSQLSGVTGNYKFGLFCAYSEDSYSTVSGTSIVATNLSMNANNAVLFNLYPSNQAYSYIFTSIFKNNRCYTSSIIIASQESQVISVGNTFFNNYNRLGNIYILNNGSYQGIFNNFLSNNGAHASILFGNNGSAEASEGGSIIYNNSVKSPTLIASDLMTPQGGLYYLDACVMSIIGSDFNANSGGYSGAVVSIESTVKLSNNTFENTWVTGAAVIGVFTPLSVVTLQNISYTNNTLIADKTLSITQTAVIDLFNSQFNIQGFNVTNDLVGGGSTLISVINSQGTIANMSVEQFYTSDGSATATSIITAVFSKINLTGITCDDTISLVKAYQAGIRIDSIEIKNLQEQSGYRFMIDLTDSSLWINQMEYIGSVTSPAALPLIGGENNEIQIINSQFLNAFNQQNKLFGLSNNGLFYISDCVFDYTQDPGKMMLFGISYSKQVIIQNSVFRGVSSVVQVSNIQNIFTFLNNVVMANSKMGILSVQESLLVYIQNNIFLGISEVATDDIIAGSQLELINPEGTTLLQGNTLINLASKNGIVGVSSQSDADGPYNVLLSLNVFVNNKGSNGGAIYLYAKGVTGKPVATIQDSVFLLNQAKTVNQNKGRGGAIYQTTPDETVQSTILKRNLYISNRADAIGGAIFYNYSPVNFDLNSQYFNNTALDRANNIGSYPTRFVLFNPEKPINITYEPGDTIPSASHQDLVTLKDVGSGVPTKQEYVFALLDQYSQVVFDDSSSNLEVQEGIIQSLRLLGGSATPFYEGPEIIADDGLYYLKDFILNYDIDKNVNMTLTSSAVPDFLTAPISAASFQKSLTVQVSFRDCGVGEYILKEGDYYTCHECPVGFWQLSSNPPASTCDPCNPISTLCLGGWNIGPTPGYWRMNEYADQVLKCPIEGACLGNPINYTPDTILNPTGVCANNYEGNLCATCVGDYGHDDNGKCIDCGKNFGYLIKFILTLIVTLLIIAFAVKWTSMFGQKFTENQLSGPKKAILIRIALHYMQVVVLIASIVVPWPAFLQQAFWIYGRISAINQQFSYLDCIIQLIADKFGVRVVFLKAGITIVSPIVFIILAIIFWVLYFLIKRRRLRRSRDFWQKISITSLILYFTMFQSALNAVLPLLNCKNIYRKDAPLYYMVSDYEVRCWTGYHWTWLIILAILTFFIWGIVFAYLAFRILRTIKRKMKENKMAKKFAWVYMGYKAERYYWEFVVLQRKVLLVCAVVFGNFHSTGLQICLFIIFMLASFSAQIIIRPYKSALFNRLEDVGCASICVLMFCVIYFQLIQDIPTLKTVVGAVGLAATLWFLGFIGIVAFRLKRMKPGEEEEEQNETASLKLSVNRSDPSAPINMSEIPFGRQPSLLSFHQRKESTVGFISNSDPHLEEEEPARHRRSIPEIPGSLIVISSEEEEKEDDGKHDIHRSPKERRIPKSAAGRQDENFMLDPDDVILQDRNKPHINTPLSVQLPRRKAINPFRDHMGEPTYPDEVEDDNSKYLDPFRRSDSKFEPPRQIFRKVANPFQDPVTNPDEVDDDNSKYLGRSSKFEPPRQIFRKTANPFQDHLGEPTHPDEANDDNSKFNNPLRTSDSKFETPRQIFRKTTNPFQDHLGEPTHPDEANNDSKFDNSLRTSDSKFEPPRQIFRKVAFQEPTQSDKLPNKTGDERISGDYENYFKSQKRTDTLSSEPATEGEAKKNVNRNSEESNLQSSGRAGKPPRRKTRASRHYLYNKDDSQYVTEGNERPFKTMNNESWQSLTLSEVAQDFNGRGSFKNEHIISEPGVFNIKDDIIEEKEKEVLEDDEIENLNGEENIAEEASGSEKRKNLGRYSN